VSAGEIATNRSGRRFSADGAYGYYAGGGGGRVALYAGALTGWTVDQNTVHANGGNSRSSSQRGGSGTIVYQVGRDPRPSLLVYARNNYNSRHRPTRLGAFGTVSAVSGRSITSDRPLEPGALAGRTLVPDAELESQTFTIVDNTASVITVSSTLAGATAVGRTFFVSDYQSRFLDVTIDGDAEVEAGHLDVSDELVLENSTQTELTSIDTRSVVVRNSAQLELSRLGFVTGRLEGSARVTARLLDGGELDIVGSSRVYNWAPSVSAVWPLRILASDLTLGSSARIDVSERGFLGSRQPGNGSRGRTVGNVPASAAYRTGGSHGGLGGAASGSATPVYGSATAPVTPGAGGTGYNRSSSSYRGGNGGGAVQIRVDQTFELSGQIRADGGRGGRYDTGGAGGAIWVRAGTVTGSGRLRADGGYGYYAGGGGGRVALQAGSVSGTPRLEADGGRARSSSRYGQSGTTRELGL
jgi:hypothetical protein